MKLTGKASEQAWRWGIFLFWPLIIGIGFVMNESAEVFVNDEFKFWSLAHLGLHSMPVFLYIVKFRKQFRFPFVEIFAVFNIVHYTLPVYFIELEDFQLGLLSLESIQVTFWAHLVFYTSFYFFASLPIRIKPVEFVPVGANLRILKYFGYICLGFYVTNKTIGIEAIAHIGYVGFFVYLGLFLSLWRENFLKRGEKIGYTIVILYDFVDRALGGLLAPFALLLLFIVISVLMSKSSKWLILIGVVLFVWFYSVFSTVKYEFRNQVWYSGQYSIIDKMLIVEQLYSDKKLSEATPMVNNYQGKDHMLWRFSYQISAMSLVLQETPFRVPYWNGVTYLPLISKFVPRFMWPDKPTEGMGYKFGTTYRVISTWNTNTSINTPILPELYMNFGYTGLYFGTFILGIIYFLLARWFSSHSVTYSSSVVGMAIIFPLMIWESNFSLLFGNLLLITLTFIILYRLMKFFTEKK